MEINKLTLLVKEEQLQREDYRKENYRKEPSLSRKVAGFVVACVSEFASAYGLTIKEASNYLKRYKGLEFLILHYEAQHLLSIDDTVEDLAQVCRNNGGGLE